MHISDVGSHFIVGLSGPSLSHHDREILKTLKPAGVLLLKRNFLQDVSYAEWTTTLQRLLVEVKSLVGRSDILVTLDHEGGRVHRTPPPLTQFPSPFLWREKVDDIGRAMGIELRSIGVNVSWSPSADIHSNPHNPVIGHRAFGTTAEEVATFAERMMYALLNEGIVACVKHYPGHGDTQTDSHFELPVVSLSKEELFQRELLPFKALCGARVPMLMTAHVLFPAIDPFHPATLSRDLLRSIIRDVWRYEGVIVSDDLDMLAIAQRFDEPGVIGEGIIAGCDMFINARHPDGGSMRPLLLAELLLDAAAKNSEVKNFLNEAKVRIEALRKNILTPYDVEMLPESIFLQHQALISA